MASLGNLNWERNRIQWIRLGLKKTKRAKKELGSSIRIKPHLRKLQFILRLFRIGILKTNQPTRSPYQAIIREHLDRDFSVVLVDHKSEFTDAKWKELGHYSGERLTSFYLNWNPHDSINYQ